MPLLFLTRYEGEKVKLYLEILWLSAPQLEDRKTPKKVKCSEISEKIVFHKNHNKTLG